MSSKLWRAHPNHRSEVLIHIQDSSGKRFNRPGNECTLFKIAPEDWVFRFFALMSRFLNEFVINTRPITYFLKMGSVAVIPGHSWKLIQPSANTSLPNFLLGLMVIGKCYRETAIIAVYYRTLSTSDYFTSIVTLMNISLPFFKCAGGARSAQRARF